MALVLEPINSLVKADLLLVQNLIKDRDCDLKGENKKEKKPRRRRIQIEEVGVLGGALTQAVAAEEITSFTTSVNEVPSLAMITPIMETSLTSPNVIAKTDEKIPNQSLSPSKLTTGLSFAQKADAIVDSSAGPSIMLETSIKTFNNDAIVPPATLFDFEREWKNRKDNPREMYMYFKAVPTSIFPTLFKNSLDAQNESKESIVGTLEGLVKIPRFGMIYSFLPRAVKDKVKLVFENLKGVDGVTELKQIYKIQ